jgi:hypothetical protein
MAVSGIDESEPRAGRLEKNGRLRRFTELNGILVVRFPREERPFGAEIHASSRKSEGD